MLEKEIVKKVAEAPAVFLEESLETAGKIKRGIISKRPFKAAEEYWNTLGPGLTTGAADDDPSGIATYSQAGARYGFQLAWTALLTFPLMAVVQEMCARIGLVTGRGLAANIKRHYAKWFLYVCAGLLFAANTFNLGADLGAMAEAMRLLLPQVNFIFFVVLFAIASLLLQVFTTYARYAKYLKYLALVLFSYVFSALMIHLDWRAIFFEVAIPSLKFSKEQIFLLCGILGTTISPYLFFWQTSQEVEEQILKGRTTVELRRRDLHPLEIRNMRVDVWSGMFISNLVMFFIIVACGATLYAQGITNITNAAEAAEALRPLAGELAFVLFTVGIVGTGMLAVPVLAGSASYALSESFGWKQGLYKKLRDAYPFYGVIVIAMSIGLLLNFFQIDPIKALLYSAVANGIVAPLVLIPIVKISSDKKIMGPYANNLLTRLIGWGAVLLMAVSGIAALASLLL